MKRVRIPFLPFTAVCVALYGLPGIVQAHPGHGDGLASGFAHPLMGLDHLLAVLAVGALAALQAKNGGTWRLPVIFTSGVLVGGGLALGGLSVPGALVEVAIAVSVLVFGAMIVAIHWTSSPARPGRIAAIACVFLFATAHGQAHGQELPTFTDPAMYVVGFVTSTIVLHLAGVLVGAFAGRSAGTLTLLRVAGGAMSVIGVGLLAGL
ncbi:MAG: HupE/UreJ family protein [Leptospirales bacterium]|jgi:urease accessory protein